MIDRKESSFDLIIIKLMDLVELLCIDLRKQVKTRFALRKISDLH